MNRLITLIALALSAYIAPSTAFIPSAQTNGNRCNSAMYMSKGESDRNKSAAIALVSAVLLAGVITVPDAALASEPFGQDIGGTSTVLAGRSGGRAGGRSSRGGSYSRSPAAYRGGGGGGAGRTVIQRNTIVTPGATYMAPRVGFGYSPFGYNPMGGFGMGYGLGAMGGGGMGRDYRQESEIQQTKMQLEDSKMKEQELAARIQALEQGQTQMQVQQQVQQQLAAPKQ